MRQGFLFPKISQIQETWWLVNLAKLNSFLGPLRSLYIEANPGWLELPLAGNNFHVPKPI